ncbi:MAG: NACHT domain-containing protein [Bacteroidales bacterium]|nr:NACHT domain-containing protein [Bacteroidales bacterium]
MSTTKEEKRDKLRSIEREVEIHALLEELLPMMGLSDVHVTHERGGHSEDGKDLICSYYNSIDGTKEWWAFVVKKGVIAGNSSSIQEIIAQTKDCFAFEYKNTIKGLRFNVNKVKVVTNAHFSNEAERKIRESDLSKNANIDFWDEDKLIDFLDKYNPLFWVKGSHQYKYYIEHFLDHIKVESITKSLGINDAKVKKILDVTIEPRLTERKEKADGSFEWVSRSVSSVVNLSNNSIIVGEPGSGKTTLFKRLSKEIIEQNALRNDAEFFPIIITFNDVKNASYDLEAAISNYFAVEWLGVTINSFEVIQRNQCVIFIDALDELPILFEKEKALKSITSFNKNHPDIRIICSSRPSDYVFDNCGTLGFNYLEIQPINIQQIKSFLSTYFADNTIKTKRLLKSLKDTGILEKLPKTPMTIALITILFEEKEVEIPATITDLYRQFVDLLLGRDTTENTMDIIEVGVRHRLLCYIAHKMHTSNRQSVALDELDQWVKSYADPRGQHIDTKAIVDDYINNTSILFTNDRGEIQFKHLSFQEYFVAYDIYNYSEDKRELLVKNFNNSWWQNVAIFYAGMSKDSTSFLNDVLNNSVPSTLHELIINTGGMGLLLQALYNTPMDDRIKGVERGLENVCSAIKIIKDKPETYKTWLVFSEYALMQIFGGFFAMSHWSITLIEVLKREFSLLFETLNYDNTEEIQTQLEYKLLIICEVLASDDYRSFSEYRKLVENSRSQSLSLFASLDTLRGRLLKQASEIVKNDEDFQKASRKIAKKAESLGDISEFVNVPLSKLLLS